MSHSVDDLQRTELQICFFRCFLMLQTERRSLKFGKGSKERSFFAAAFRPRCSLIQLQDARILRKQSMQFMNIHRVNPIPQTTIKGAMTISFGVPAMQNKIFERNPAAYVALISTVKNFMDDTAGLSSSKASRSRKTLLRSQTSKLKGRSQQSRMVSTQQPKQNPANCSSSLL